MHRIATTDARLGVLGLTRQSLYLRAALTLAYLCFATSGVLLLVTPEVTVAYDGWGPVLSAFMALGSVLASGGSLTRRWVGEFTGLPLLASAFAVFGIGTVYQAWEVSRLIAAANGLLFAGMVLVMTARWRVALASYRFAHAVALRDRRTEVRGGRGEREGWW